MPDFGILKGLRQGAKGARVARGTKDIAAAKTAAANTQARTAVGLTAVQPAAIPKSSGIAQSVSRAAAARRTPVASARVLESSAVDGEAKRLSTLELGEYDLEATHQINFDRITTTDEVKAVIADTAERNKGRIEVARRGVIANEQLKLLAADLDVEEDVVRAVMERESGGVLNPETILAARQVKVASAARILDLGKKISSGLANDLDRVQFRRQIQFHDDFQTGFMGARAEAGRSLNAFNIPVGAELDGELLGRMRRTVDNLNGNDTDELAAMISQMESGAQVDKFTKQYTRSKVAGVLQELFVSNILSGPKTQLVNTFGNALFQGMNNVEYGVAAQVGKLLPGADHVQVGEASAMLFGQMTGWRDGMRYAWLAFKNGEALDNVVKYEGHTRRAISSQNLLPKGAPPSVAGAIDLIGSVIRFPIERLMVPTDEFFKTIAYRSDLARQAFLEVNQRIAGGAKMNQGEIAGFVKSYLENPSTSVRKKADDYALYTTFQTELGVAGRNAQLLVAATPGGFVIAPFVKTPVNIFKAGLLERSPLAVFSSTFRKAIANGGPERDLAVARVAMGSLTVAATAAAVTAGRITGGGPQDPGARALLEATGWQPYSLVYEDENGDTKYQSYARAEPLAYVIGATADAVEIRAFMDAEDPLASENENMNRAIAGVTAAVANNTMSKTFMSGVADFSQALDDPGRYMKGFMERSTQAFIPFSSFRRQVGQMQDPLIREAWDYTDKLKASSGLAGYSEGLPPRRNVFGDPIEWKGGSVLGVMSPFPDTTHKADSVADEVVAVMQESGSIPVTMPSRKIEGMALNAEEYDQMVRAGRQEPNFGGGLTFHDKLDELFTKTAYLVATPDMRAVLIKQVREDADRIGRARLEADNDEFASRLALHRLKKTELLQGAVQ